MNHSEWSFPCQVPTLGGSILESCFQTSLIPETILQQREVSLPPNIIPHLTSGVDFFVCLFCWEYLVLFEQEPESLQNDHLAATEGAFDLP